MILNNMENENDRSNIIMPEQSGEQNNDNMNVDGDADEEHSLVIDEILDDFCEFEIKEELDAAENPEMAESNLVTIYPSEINYSAEERNREEEAEDEEQEDPSLEHVKSQSKYGKLWEFIRDLLQNETYNPSIIKWENVEEGMFRIVDSIALANLWAIVKGNKSMNYEKLSRAMRYYYKINVFAIVERRRLVYKFGPMATGWKPNNNEQEERTSLNVGPCKRCKKCLCLFPSEYALEEHSMTCNKTINLESFLRSKKKQEFSMSGQNLPVKKIALQQNKEEEGPAKSQCLELLRIPQEPCSEPPAQNVLSDEGPNTEFVINPVTQQAVKSVTCGVDNEHVETKTPVRVTTPEVNEHLRSLVTSAPSAGGHSMGLLNTSTNDMSSFLSNSTPDKKIEYLRTASEKSKTQTILQKRPEHNPYAARTETPPVKQNSNLADNNSDDDVKIVDIVKKETGADQSSGQSIEEVVENVMKSQKEIGSKFPNSKIVINNQFINYVVPSSSSSPSVISGPGGIPGTFDIQKSRVQTSIRVNPKYASQPAQSVIRLSPPPQPEIGGAERELEEGEKELEKLLRENEEAMRREKKLDRTLESLRKSMDQEKNYDEQLKFLLNEKDNLMLPEEPSQKQVEPTKNVEADDKTDSSIRKTIRLNPKYTLVGGQKPEDCGNIADTGQGQAAPFEPPEKIVRSASSGPGPRLITINPKYGERIPVISSPQRPASSSPPCSSPSLTNLLRSESAQRKEVSSHSHLVTLPQMPRLATSIASSSPSSSILNDMLAAPSKKVYVPPAYQSSQISPLASSLPSNQLKRKFDDRVESPNRMRNEPLPGLWKFFVAVLHNPNFNPKLIAWEQLDRGAFRIRYLKDLFILWTNMRGTEINYDLFSKTVRFYDDKGFLHPVEGMRCVYRFGRNAMGWRPEAHEITGGGKHHFPNQATWPQSRFYKEFSTHFKPAAPPPPSPTSSSGGGSGDGVTTLFTLRPLDNTATSISEMKVMSDNSSIVKTNTATTASNVILPPKTHAMPKLTPMNVLRNVKPAPRTNPVTTFSSTKSVPSFPVPLSQLNPKPLMDLGMDNDDDGVGVNCKIVFPKHQSEPAKLKFDNGLIMELDRALFSAVEKKVTIFQLNNRPNSSYPLKDNHFVRKIKKRKHFMRRTKFHPERHQSHRFMNILPKPGMASLPTAPINEVGVLSNNPLYNKRRTLTGSNEIAGTNVHPENPLTVVIDQQLATMSRGPVTAALPAPQPSASRTIELIKIEDDPEELTTRHVESVRSSDIDFISTDDEDSFGHRASMDTGDENVEGQKKQRENVIRCKIYRDKKKEEQLEGERQLARLEAENESARAREALLDKSIAVLRQTYISLVEQGRICGACSTSSDEAEEAAKEEPTD